MERDWGGRQGERWQSKKRGGRKFVGGKKVMVFVFIYVASYYILM